MCDYIICNLRSEPGKRVFPVSISAMMQPTDLLKRIKTKKKANVNSKQKTNKPEVDGVVVVHPVEHDLGSSVPTSRHVAGHFVLSRPENHRFIQLLFSMC